MLILVYFFWIPFQIAIGNSMATTMSIESLDWTSSLETQNLILQLHSKCECSSDTQPCLSPLIRYLQWEHPELSLQETCIWAGITETNLVAMSHCTSLLHLQCPSNSSGLITKTFYAEEPVCHSHDQEISLQLHIPITQSPSWCDFSSSSSSSRWFTWMDAHGQVWNRFIVGVGTRFMQGFDVLPWTEIPLSRSIDIPGGLTISSLWTSIVVMESVPFSFHVVDLNQSRSNQPVQMMSVLELCDDEHFQFTFFWNGTRARGMIQQEQPILESSFNFTWIRSCPGRCLRFQSPCQSIELWANEIGNNHPFELKLNFPMSKVSVLLQWSIVTQHMAWQKYNYLNSIVLLSMALGLIWIVCVYEYLQTYCRKKRGWSKQHRPLGQEDEEQDEQENTNTQIEMSSFKKQKNMIVPLTDHEKNYILQEELDRDF